MKFQTLAQLLSDLEATSKRLEMIDILAAFFRDLKQSKSYKDLKKVVYLLQGKLVSNIKQFPKMGIAEKMILEALSLHSGINKSKIKELLLKKGDIGLTAETVLSKRKKQKSLIDFNNSTNKIRSIEINEIYSELKKVAKTEGSGSE
jgi:DNA ligase-1